MKTRIISGAVGIALLVIVVLLYHTVVFNIALGLVAALMVYELSRAEKLDKNYAFTIAGALYAFFCPFAVFFEKYSEPFSADSSERFAGRAADLAVLIFPYIAASFAYIVIATAILLVFHKNITAGPFYVCAAYNLLITACMTSLAIFVKYFDDLAISQMIFVFMGAWVADSGAYFAGTFFGKHKLCPEISPKKTVEGLLGGMAANALAFWGYALFLNSRMGEGDERISLIGMAIAGVICCLLGLMGDLTASLIKRECGIKDYGNIMPGHGGALDRFDSLIYIAPFWLLISAR